MYSAAAVLSPPGLPGLAAAATGLGVRAKVTPLTTAPIEYLVGHKSGHGQVSPVHLCKRSEMLVARTPESAHAEPMRYSLVRAIGRAGQRALTT
mmetsp:Transcript_7421/g.19070  ORF Transcript_7421/g.19070 Transcript_7421/m.19070 type:complete len:94 (-) Transcript_7421:326-607(-)